MVRSVCPLLCRFETSQDSSDVLFSFTFSLFFAPLIVPGRSIQYTLSAMLFNVLPTIVEISECGGKQAPLHTPLYRGLCLKFVCFEDRSGYDSMYAQPPFFRVPRLLCGRYAPPVG